MDVFAELDSIPNQLDEYVAKDGRSFPSRFLGCKPGRLSIQEGATFITFEKWESIFAVRKDAILFCQRTDANENLVDVCFKAVAHSHAFDSINHKLRQIPLLVSGVYSSYLRGKSSRGSRAFLVEVPYLGSRQDRGYWGTIRKDKQTRTKVMIQVENDLGITFDLFDHINDAIISPDQKTTTIELSIAGVQHLTKEILDHARKREPVKNEEPSNPAPAISYDRQEAFTKPAQAFVVIPQPDGSLRLVFSEVALVSGPLPVPPFKDEYCTFDVLMNGSIQFTVNLYQPSQVVVIPSKVSPDRWSIVIDGASAIRTLNSLVQTWNKGG